MLFRAVQRRPYHVLSSESLYRDQQDLSHSFGAFFAYNVLHIGTDRSATLRTNNSIAVRRFPFGNTTQHKSGLFHSWLAMAREPLG